MTPLEQAAQAYWNAFRDGFGRVGGDMRQYPTWQQARDDNSVAVRNEALRCMRHAMEALKPFWGQEFSEIFPDKPSKRSAARTIQDDLMAGKVK